MEVMFTHPRDDKVFVAELEPERSGEKAMVSRDSFSEILAITCAQVALPTTTLAEAYGGKTGEDFIINVC